MQGGDSEAERFLNQQGLNLNSAALQDTSSKAQTLAGDAYVQGKPFLYRAADIVTPTPPGLQGKYALGAVAVY